MAWQKVRISKATLKGLDPVVAREISRLQQRYATIKSFTYERKDAGYKLYLGEDERFTVVYQGQAQTVEMVGSHNMGAADLNYKVGTYVPMPTGCVILQVYYGGTRGYQLHIVNVDDTPLLPAA